MEARKKLLAPDWVYYWLKDMNKTSLWQEKKIVLIMSEKKSPPDFLRRAFYQFLN
jgi:hypothetical protein